MGYIYLLQPAELVGTNRYKIGISSKDNLNRLRSYGCGTRYMFFLECDDFFAVEDSLKRAFNKDSRIKLIKGKEYFEGEERAIMNIFMNVVWNEKLKHFVDQRENEIGEYVDTDVDMESCSEEEDVRIISFGKTINKFKFNK